jgi:hypothetical protein
LGFVGSTVMSPAFAMPGALLPTKMVPAPLDESGPASNDADEEPASDDPDEEPPPALEELDEVDPIAPELELDAMSP